jgi:hypothetical protein
MTYGKVWRAIENRFSKVWGSAEIAALYESEKARMLVKYHDLRLRKMLFALYSIAKQAYDSQKAWEKVFAKF